VVDAEFWRGVCFVEVFTYGILMRAYMCMCVSLYVCVCVSIYIYIYIYIYIIFFNTYMGMYVCVCVYIYIYSYIFMKIQIHIQTHIYAHNCGPDACLVEASAPVLANMYVYC
jgi:hypothetical protein